MRFPVRALFTVIFLTVTIAAQAASVSGTVTSAASGAPLGGMVVAAYDTTGTLRGTATTDATGLYVLSLPEGDYRFLAFDPAGVYATMFDANADSFETTPVRRVGAGGAQVSFALVRGGTIAGRVQTSTGAGRPDAVVEAYNLSGTRRGFTTTNSTGDYALVLPPGQYKVIAYDPGGVYAASFFVNARSFDQAAVVQVNEGAATAVVLTLGLAARVTGTAVDAATGAPLAGILVYAYTPSGGLVATTSTDAAGAFRFVLPAGDYRFVAADAARVYATAFFEGSRSFEGARVVALAAGEQRGNLRLALARGARISGRVNAANLLVGAYNLDGTLHAETSSDANGHYALLVAPGEYRIAVSDPALELATRFYGDTPDFSRARTINVIADTAGIDVTLPQGGRVSGTVRSDPHGQLLGGMIVAAYDESGLLVASGTTRADGRYAFVVAPGTYRLVAFDPQINFATGYAGGATSYETSGPVAVAADADITADFTLRRGVRVSGTVRNESGNALTGIDVFALDASGNRVASATTSGGAFTLAVAPGTYRFLAVDPQRRHAAGEPTAEITIREGQVPPPIALTLRGLGRRRSVRH